MNPFATSERQTKEFGIPVSRGASLILISFEVDRDARRRPLLLRLASGAEPVSVSVQLSSKESSPKKFKFARLI
jgi:hypothetical protein